VALKLPLNGYTPITLKI